MPSTAPSNEVLLLPIEIHLTLCGLQATHRSLAGLLLQSCLVVVSLLATWCVEQWHIIVRRQVQQCDFLQHVFKICQNDQYVLLLLVHMFSVLSLQLKKLWRHNKSAIDLSNADPACGHKEVRRSTGHIMMTIRYSDQQVSTSRQKVMRL